jgi:hypothetical protein
MFGRTCTLIVLLAGLAGIGGGIAAPQGAVTRYLIVSGDSISGSWDFRDEHLIERLRSQYGNHFVWFRQAAHDYVGSGDSLLVDIEAAMAPQREVNRQQNDVNRHQNEVNRQQNDVNLHQRDVNRDQAEVNRRQSEVNHVGGVGQDEVNRIQHDVNAKQNDVNAEQRKMNDQQSVVNKEQNVVNQAQREANVQIKEALDLIFDSALARGLVHEVK